MPTLCCFAIDVNQIKPNTTVLFDDKAISYPVNLSDIERGEYYVQAVWDRNLGVEILVIAQVICLANQSKLH